MTWDLALITAHIRTVRLFSPHAAQHNETLLRNGYPKESLANTYGTKPRVRLGCQHGPWSNDTHMGDSPSSKVMNQG